MDKNYLAAVEKKLKKQGKTEEEVEAFIKNLVNPNIEEEKVEVEASEPASEVGEPTASEETPVEPEE